MITLSDKDRFNKSGHSSKGDQLKFKKDDVWYKADELGYEGLSEAVTSQILIHSNIDSFVLYNICNFDYNEKSYIGCRSDNFKPEGAELITSYRLVNTMYNDDIADLVKASTVKESIEKYVSIMSKCTGLKEEEIGKYTTQLIELDAFILNDDRHYNNIAFLYVPGKGYTLPPIFDNGAAFLSDKTYYLNGVKDIGKSYAKPFSENYDEQMTAAEDLFGRQLEITYSDYMEFMPNNIDLYPDEDISRVADIIKYQIKRYPGLFITVGKNTPSLGAELNSSQ